MKIGDIYKCVDGLHYVRIDGINVAINESFPHTGQLYDNPLCSGTYKTRGQWNGKGERFYLANQPHTNFILVEEVMEKQTSESVWLL